MKKKKRRLWIRALNGDGKACRKLTGYYQKEGDRELKEELLKKAVLYGDEKAFFIGGQQYSDPESYAEMLKDYEKVSDKKQKKKIKKYLVKMLEGE